MGGRTVRIVCVLAAVLLLPNAVSVWIDDDGHTYLTDRPPENAEPVSPEELSRLWEGEFRGSVAPPDSGSRPRDPVLREVALARDELSGGDTKRGLARLRRLMRMQPGRPEPAWLLARTQLRRGRLPEARRVLEGMLQTAAPVEGDWREAAQQLLGEVAAEELVANAADPLPGPIPTLETPHFHIHYDHRFASRDFGTRTVDLLDRARTYYEDTLGRTLDRPLEVRLYTRASYLKRYKHRFGFATVGFYDGAIHVVSARHPRRELLALLTHEYGHALFKDAVGSHRPFFLNEGIADGAEERIRGRERLSRAEWRRLLDADREETWIPFEALVGGFNGLEGSRALLAYLQSRAAVEWLEREQPGAIGRWLERCADGEPWEDALEVVTGRTVAGLDTAVRSEVRSRFPTDPLLSSLVP